MKNDDDLDSLSLEDKAKDKHKNAEIGLNHWTKWMAKHRQLNQSILKNRQNPYKS